MYATIEQILGREKQHNDERFLYNIKEWYNYSKIDFDKDIFYKPWSKHKTVKVNKPKLQCKHKKYSIQKKAKKGEGRLGQVIIKRQDGKFKPRHINNHINYKWSKYTPKMNKYPH